MNTLSLETARKTIDADENKIRGDSTSHNNQSNDSFGGFLYEKSMDNVIKSLDLECIAFKIALDEGWSLEKIDYIEIEYRWFLQAIKTYKDIPIATKRDIDIFWHHHILDTRKYMEDCERIFGRYIHHFPYSGVMGEQDAYEQNQRFRLSKKLIEELKYDNSNI